MFCLRLLFVCFFTADNRHVSSPRSARGRPINKRVAQFCSFSKVSIKTINRRLNRLLTNVVAGLPLLDGSKNIQIRYKPIEAQLLWYNLCMVIQCFGVYFLGLMTLVSL